MGEPRVIKRYANRKLYDTLRSRYVTLDQIAEMIRQGEDVTILDNNSKEDLTTVTLAQIIYEEEKKQKSFLPLNAMRNIIQSGGERIEELMSQAQRRVTGVFSRRSANEAQPAGGTAAAEVDGAPEPGAPDAVDDGAEARREGARALHEFREWLESSQRTIDDWQRKVDERIRHAIEGLSPLSSVQKEIITLGARLAELEQRVAELDKR